MGNGERTAAPRAHVLTARVRPPARAQLTRALAAAALALTGVAVAGCGSGGTHPSSTTNAAATTASKAASTATPTSSSTTATAPTNAATARFAAQARVICQSMSAREKSLKRRQETLKGHSLAAIEREFASLAGELADLSTAAGSRLAKLPRPAADAAAIERLLSAFASEANDVRAISKAVTSGESTAGEQATQELKDTASANAAEARRLGLEDCIGSE